MSNKDKPHRFDPQRWKQQQLETMTNAAMRRKDAEFVAAHRDDTDEQLIAYLQQCAQELGNGRSQILDGSVGKCTSGSEIKMKVKKTI